MGRTTLSIAILVLVPSRIWAQGEPQGPEFRINTYTTLDQVYPVVAAVPGGGFTVVWQSFGQDGSNFGVFGQRFDASGAALGYEFRVNTHTTNHQRFASIAADASGDFVVVWSSFGQDGSVEGVFGQRFAGTGTPIGTEFRVNTYTTGNQRDASVAVDSSGNFVVVWATEAGDGSGYAVAGQRFDNSGAPLGSEFRANTYTTNDQEHPVVTASPSGDFLVVWDSTGQEGMFQNIYGQRYALTGSPLGSEFRANSSTASGGFQPAAEADTTGNFVIAWTGPDSSLIGVFGRRFAANGAPLSPDFRINTYTTSQQFDPDIAIDASGNFVVVWHDNQQDGSFYGVFAQRFGASGDPTGPEFRVNTFTFNGQLAPAVAADAAGNFLVVWESPQDGSNGGVYGQRFGRIVHVELMRFGVE